MEKEQYWSKFAEDYEEKTNYVVGSEDMAIILDEVEQQKDLKDVLELGCGSGTYSKILSKAATRLTATDFSDEMVAVAKSRLRSYKNIKVEKADCFNIPYPESSFDTIVMANLLHVIPEPEKCLIECRRVLKKNGKIVVISYTFEGVSLINSVLMLYRYLKAFGRPSPSAQTLTLKKAEEMLIKNGFQVEESKLIGKKMKAIFIKGHC